jgi:hypothetical protein
MGSCASKDDSKREESTHVVVEKTDESEKIKLRKTKETSRKQDSIDERKNLLASGQTNTDDLNDSPKKKINVQTKDSTVGLVDIPDDKS